MRKLLLATALMAATPLLAQEEPGFFSRLFGTDQTETDEEQGGLLERFIEDNLSGEGRTVSITGFEGALSGRATLDSLTISDADGEWLTLTDVVLDWSRGALFRGRLEVEELSAAEILLPRLPAPSETTQPPSPEASGFSLPELPVSIALEKIAAERVEIGQPVFGVATLVSVDGGLSLEGGEGSARLVLDKLDAPGGISLDASYSNTTTVLALDLSMSEDRDGILATLTNLPGRPALEFTAKGNAPLAEFAADIRLATDGVERLSGRIATTQRDDAEQGTLTTVADISGDIAPLFLPEYQSFFGPQIALGATVTSFPDGRLALTGMEMSAAALLLNGTVEIGSDGLPDLIDLTGEIASDDGDVLLPLAGPETRVGRVDLTLGFDASASEDWTGDFRIAGLDRPGFSAEAVRLAGTGRIVAEPEKTVTASLEFAATALDLGDPAASEALGEEVSGRADIDWTEGGPVRLRDLVIDGESYGFEGEADLAVLASGPKITGRARVNADRLSVFSGLAARPLGGAVVLDTTFGVEPLAGTFDVEAEGEGKDLRVGHPQADGLLAGTTRLDLAALRNEAGISVDLRQLASEAADVIGQATLTSGGSHLEIQGSLTDAAAVLPELQGPVRLDFEADEDADRNWLWSTEASFAGNRVSANGTLSDLYYAPRVTAAGQIEASDLADFAAFLDRPLAGRATLGVSGSAALDGTSFDVNVAGQGSGLAIGMSEIDGLLMGDVVLNVSASRDGQTYIVTVRELVSETVNLNGEAALSPGASRVRAKGRLSDAGVVLPELSGPVDLDFVGEEDANRVWAWRTDSAFAGTRVTADGTLSDLETVPRVTANGRVEAGDLSDFARLLERPLAGQLTLEGSGGLLADLSEFDIRATANGNGVRVGQDAADRLLAGTLTAAVDAAGKGGMIAIETLSLATDLLSLSTEGTLSPDGSGLTLEARLADVGPFAPGFSGPATASGRIGQEADGAYTLNLDVTGPAGSSANASGSIASDFATFDLAVAGRAELAFLNQFVAPQAVSGTLGFDLAVNGPPALSSVSGNLSSSGARLIAPTVGLTLNDIALDTSLASGRAQVSLTGNVDNGGRLSISGPVTLTAPFPANLDVTLAGVVLRDPKLFETTLDGTIGIDGPLTGGARIAGRIGLGETNIRIPSSGLGGTGAVPEIIHLNEPPPVRGTRQRAGLTDASSDGKGSGPAYPLDVFVDAPNRIFIRGRGLDSEFGGSLRITGTTNNVVPIGAFNLIRGRLDILGQRLSLNEATATVQGSFLPVVRIRAETQSDEYTVNVNVDGAVDNPDITFTSEPELPQEEVLARLIFGRGLETLSPLQAARLALAVRTLAGRGGEGVVGNIRNSAGLADLDVTTDEEGNTAVRAGTYLGENIYTDVTVGSNGETEVNLNLDLTSSVTAKGSVTNEGETSVGIFYERDY